MQGLTEFLENMRITTFKLRNVQELKDKIAIEIAF